MRKPVLIALALMVAVSAGLTPVPAAHATDRPGDTTLLDEVFRMEPGASLNECISVAQMTHLTVFVSSPLGRTGETAALNFSDNRQTVSPNVQLFVNEIPTEQIMSTHLAPAGSYCYFISVTHTLTSILPADAPERPYKNVHLKIVSTPYLP